MKNITKIYLSAIAMLLAFSVNSWALPYPVAVGEIITMLNGDTAAQYEGNYQFKNSAGNIFGTFCLEESEYFNPGYKYKVSNISSFAENGGIGGATNGKDELSFATKWLYSHFLSKDILAVTGIAENDYAMQLAIWTLEEERAYSNLSGAAKTYYDKAIAADTKELLAFDLKAMNLVNDGNDGLDYLGKTSRQSQLVGAPVPEPSTFLLLAAGLLGAGLLRRRSRK